MPDYDDGFDEWYADYQADTSEDKPETVHDIISQAISGGDGGNGDDSGPDYSPVPGGSPEPSPQPSGDGGNGGGGGTPGGSFEEGYVPGIISAEEYAEKYPEIPTVHQLWEERASILSDIARDVIDKISSPGGVWSGFAEPGTPETSLESIATGTTVFWGWEWDPEKRKEMTFCELYPWHPSCWVGDGDGDGGGAPWFNLQFPSINIPGVGASDWSWLIWLALGGGVLLVLYKWATKKQIEVKTVYAEE